MGSGAREHKTDLLSPRRGEYPSEARGEETDRLSPRRGEYPSEARGRGVADPSGCARPSGRRRRRRPEAGGSTP
jgi:hypothetical protein